MELPQTEEIPAQSLFTAKPCSPLAFSWHSVWFPLGYSGHNKATTHFITDNMTGIYACIISNSGLWQCFKNVLKSNKTPKSLSVKHRHHVLLLLVTLSQILQGIFTTDWCTVLSYPSTTPAQEQLRAAELAKSQSFCCHFWPLGFEPCGFTTQDLNRLSFPGLLVKKMLHEWIRYSSSATFFTLLRI